MSGRDPHYLSPEAAMPRIVTPAYPERMVARCIEMGLPVRLYAPDLANDPKLEVIATRAQIKQARAIEPIGNESYFRHKPPEWWDKFRSFVPRLRAAQGRCQEFAAICRELDDHCGRPTIRGREYEREDENKPIARMVRCSDMSGIVIDTCIGRGLRCERVSLPERDFVIVKVWATKQDFRAAQYDWLQQMIATQPKQLTTATSELDLFA